MISDSLTARRLIIATAAASAALMLLSFVAQHYFSFVCPLALCVGCVFAVFNLVFYKFLSAAVLGMGSSQRGLMAALALLKLPLLAVLVFALSRQSLTFIANVLAGSLIFIPGALLAALKEDENGKNMLDQSTRQ